MLDLISVINSDIKNLNYWWEFARPPLLSLETYVYQFFHYPVTRCWSLTLLFFPKLNLIYHNVFSKKMFLIKIWRVCCYISKSWSHKFWEKRIFSKTNMSNWIYFWLYWPKDNSRIKQDVKIKALIALYGTDVGQL